MMRLASWVAFGAIALTAVPAQADQCRERQLKYYAERYDSAEACWAREQTMKGATEECCKVAFGEAEAAETVKGAQNGGGTSISRPNPSGKLRTQPFVLHIDARDRCSPKGGWRSEAFQSCYADLMGRLVLANEPEIADICASVKPHEQVPCAMRIYDGKLIERAANGDLSVAFEDEYVYWCSDAGNEYVYTTGYYTTPGNGCSSKERQKSIELERLRRLIKYLRSRLAGEERDDVIREINFRIRELDIALGMLMNQ